MGEALHDESARPIRVLFLAANPRDTEALRLDEEARAIEHTLRNTDYRDQFELVTNWAVRTSDLVESLLRHRPDVVHFSGHGSAESEIILEDTVGASHAVPKAALAGLFRVLKDNVRCVVLNACYSADQAVAIAGHIDCVVGMSRSIGDGAAINFATAFYRALGYGRDIKTAFDLACLEIGLIGLDEESTPQLIASNVDPCRIRLLDQRPTGTPVLPPPHLAPRTSVKQAPPSTGSDRPNDPLDTGTLHFSATVMGARDFDSTLFELSYGRWTFKGRDIEAIPRVIDALMKQGEEPQR